MALPSGDASSFFDVEEDLTRPVVDESVGEWVALRDVSHRAEY